MATNNVLNNVVEQSLEPRIMTTSHKLSKMWKMVYPNAGDGSVVKPEFGQGWVLRRLFSVGMAGAVRHTSMSSRSALVDSVTNTTSNPNVNILGETAGDWWQGADVSVMPSYFVYQTPITKILGNMHAELELVRTDSLDANKARVFADIVRGTSDKVALTMCNDFLAETDTITCQGGRIATFEGCVLGAFDPGTLGDTLQGQVADFNSADCVSDAYTLTKGAVRRFRVGQEVDLIAGVATDHRFQILNPQNSPLIVQVADAGADTIKFINLTGVDITIPANTVGLAGATNYVLIIPHGALSNQTWAATDGNDSINADVNAAGTTYLPTIPFSVERYLKNTGGLCGTGTNHVTTSTPSNSIDLARFPEYKSYVEAVNAPLDEKTLFLRAARCQYSGFSGEDMWDKAWMTPGSFASYAESQDGAYTFERNGRRLDLRKQGVEEGIGFGAFGDEWTIDVDPLIGKGKLYGEITRNRNFKMQVVPRIDKSRSSAGFPKILEFVVPKLNPGANDIWQGAKGIGTAGISASGITNAPAGVTTSLMEAPFWMVYQTWKDNYRGMKLSGLVEEYGPTY